MLRLLSNSILQWRRWPLMLSTALLLCSAAAPIWGQAAWEFTPYQVQIWLALPDDPTWQDAQLEQIRGVLAGRAETTFGPLWDSSVQLAPEALAGDIRYRLNDLKVDQAQAAAPKRFSADKIYLVGVQDEQGLLKVQVRELDYRARQLGVLLERETPQREALPWVIWDAIAQAFTPLVRVERVDGPNITTRLRAGGLITAANSPAWIKKDAVLRPVIRKNDRAGEPLKGGINLIPWTMLEVQEQVGSILTCKLHSGYRSPIPSKGGARTDRLALLVRPQFPSTVLHLRSRDKVATPLGGYEVWRKISSTDGELLGSTDWRGNIELPKAETGALQTLLVRSGGQLLARLPLVPGQQPQMEAAVANDDGRLQAEGFVTALQSKIMDLEARRHIAAARIRTRLKDNKLDEAQKILEEMRTFESRADLGRMLDQQRVKSSDPATQKRIDKLIADARVLLSKFLDPDLPNVLQRELIAAKDPKTAPSAAKTQPKTATKQPANTATTSPPAPSTTSPAPSAPMPAAPMPAAPMPMPPGK
jgi:hypothetical protein